MVACEEYVSRFVVAAAIPNRSAESVARFLMEEVVLRHGPFRELMTDGARELVGNVIESLVVLLQAKQSTPVPYRPNLMGLVERFNRTWKDVVSSTVSAAADVWDEWVQASTSAYNSVVQTTTGFMPHQFMTGMLLSYQLV